MSHEAPVLIELNPREQRVYDRLRAQVVTPRLGDASGLRDLSIAASEIWLVGSQIAFRGADAPDGIPVIADPIPPSAGGPREIGDVDVSSPFEATCVAQACDQAWSERYPEQRGLILVGSRRFVGDNSARAVAMALPKELRVGEGHALTLKYFQGGAGSPEPSVHEEDQPPLVFEEEGGVKVTGHVQLPDLPDREDGARVAVLLQA